ncbi:MAG: hypothetical protein ACFFCD_12485 [Promethearchaeota archaeon]
MSRRSKGKVCSIENCENEAVRSLSIEKAGEALSSAGLNYKSSRRNRIYLCTEHYKKIKKYLKKAQKEERLRLTGGRPF